MESFIQQFLKIIMTLQDLIIVRSSIPEVIYKKYVLENFTKFTDKHLCPSLFLNKAVGWKPETVRSSHWRYSVKKGALAFQNQCSIDHLQSKCSWIIHKIHCEKPVLESFFNKIAVLRTYNFTKEDSKTGAFL